MEKKILDILFICFILMIFYVTTKHSSVSKRNFKWIISVIIFFVVIAGLLISVNINSNTGCRSDTQKEQIIPNLTQAYCVASCYCDGFQMNNVCIGSFRKVCQNK